MEKEKQKGWLGGLWSAMNRNVEQNMVYPGGTLPDVTVTGDKYAEARKKIAAINDFVRHFSNDSNRQIDREYIVKNYIIPTVRNLAKEKALEAIRKPQELTIEGLATAPLGYLGGAKAAKAASKLVSGVKNILTPGSAFWNNPLTKGMAASIAGGNGIDAASKFLTGNTWGENVGGLIERTTGWNPRNSQWTNVLLDMTNPGYFTPYGAVEKGVIQTTNKALSRARDAIYNNVTPYGYGTPDMGAYTTSKPKELAKALGEFLMPKRKINTTYPRWKKRYDNFLTIHPEEAHRYIAYDYDNITLPAIMEMREQAWAKAMKQPKSKRWTDYIYKDNHDGTYSYDLDAVDKIRTKYDGNKFSGAPSDEVGQPRDNITTNGGNVRLIENEDGTLSMYDVWDLHPFHSRLQHLLNPKDSPTPTIGQKVVQKSPQFVKKGIDKLSQFEAVDFLDGNKFILNMKWDPYDPKFWNP